MSALGDSYFTRDRLKSSLTLVEEVFDTQEILSLHHGKEQIIEYYHTNKPGYQHLHTASGAVHLAINPDGVFSRKGFRYQADQVSDILNREQCSCVVELGCCKGFNILMLAAQHPAVQFTGIDIATGYLHEARKSGSALDNVAILEADFHTMPFQDDALDMVYEIESTCYAQDHLQVLTEIARVLRKGGVYVAFDFFRSTGFHRCDDRLKYACKLVEKSTSIPAGINLAEWIDLSQQAGFQVDMVQDLTQAIIPNLRKFHTISSNYFRVPGVARTLNKVLPYDLVRNNVAGLLMPYTMALGAQAYTHIVLRK